MIWGLNVDVLDQRLKQPPYDRFKLSVLLHHVDNKKPVYTYNSQQLMVPASLVKLVLTATCLNDLGKHFRYRTNVYLDHSNPPSIYIKGVGDPNITVDQLQLVAQLLRQKNIDVIDRIVLDDGQIMVDDVNYGVSPKYYYAGYGGLNAHYNQVQLSYDFNQRQFLFEPDSGYSNIIAFDLDVFDSVSQRGFPIIKLYDGSDNDIYTVTGKMTALDTQSNDFKLRVSKPGVYFAQLMQKQLAAAGIVVLNDVRFTDVNISQLNYVTHLLSPSLVDYLKVLNQESNNMLAMGLAATLGRLYEGVPGTLSGGVRRLDYFLTKTRGFAYDSFYFKDSSGLSHANGLTAQQLMSTLDFLQQRYANDFTQLLVNIDESGDYADVTINDRYEVYVKSGTLSSIGVNNLAAEIYDKISHIRYNLVIMCQVPSEFRPAFKGQFTKPLLEDLLQ